MLIIDARESDSLDKALRVYKKKYEKAGVMKEVRARQSFTKPSITKRDQKLKAIYRDQIRRIEE
ncbi:MAG: 30S ribosomal protein S21 [Chitinophagales bacterium]|nr:30S ribosomal protein S21 [Chitinophagales bacterium]MCZ2392706.1 30S ribosomal protein S21 [Chitinophagales bacterium]